MPRYKHYEYDQSLLLPVTFSEQIMPGTLEYTIHYLVEEKIDIAPLEERFCNEETGAPAYGPKMLLKIILLSYSRGVISSRRIEKLCRENIFFQALTAGTQPDFTTIAHFVRSMRDEVRFLFSDILLYCNELDLLGGITFAKVNKKLSKKVTTARPGMCEISRHLSSALCPVGCLKWTGAIADNARHVPWGEKEKMPTGFIPVINLFYTKHKSS